MVKCDCGSCECCVIYLLGNVFPDRPDPMKESEELHKIQDSTARVAKGILPQFLVYIQSGVV